MKYMYLRWIGAKIYTSLVIHCLDIARFLNIKKIHIRKLIMKCIIDNGVYIHGNDFMSIWFHIGVGISRAQVRENRTHYRITLSISLKMNFHSSVNLLYHGKFLCDSGTIVNLDNCTLKYDLFFLSVLICPCIPNYFFITFF